MSNLEKFKAYQIDQSKETKNLRGGEIGRIDPGEGATAILALGAIGGPATFAFALPIALSLYMLE